MRSVMVLGAFLALAACDRDVLHQDRAGSSYADPYRDRDETARPQPREVLRDDMRPANDYCLRNPGACRRH